MNKTNIYQLIISWGVDSISSEFSEVEMTKDISLLGLDSIDVVEFCEFLEEKFNIEVDYDWVMEFETLTDLGAEIEQLITA